MLVGLADALRLVVLNHGLVQAVLQHADLSSQRRILPVRLRKQAAKCAWFNPSSAATEEGGQHTTHETAQEKLEYRTQYHPISPKEATVLGHAENVVCKAGFALRYC